MRRSRYLDGPITRTRRSQKKYNEYKREKKNVSAACVLCDTNEMVEPVDHGNFYVVKNRFGYDAWEGFDVTDHLMVVPKQHIAGTSEMTDAEKIKYLALLAEYQDDGYSVYNRAMIAPTRTIEHMHTHLIKLDDTPYKTLFYLTRPHILLTRK